MDANFVSLPACIFQTSEYLTLLLYSNFISFNCVDILWIIKPIYLSKLFPAEVAEY